MSALSALLILVTTLATSFLSGIFGMAGGLILMGVLVALVTVPMAMIIHGSIQMVANGYRAYLLRAHIDWSIIRLYLIGAALGLGLLLFISFTPEKRVVYLLLGLTPMLIWVPKSWLHLDIRKPAHAIFGGFGVQLLNTTAGVAGPLLDLFLVRTAMTRQEIVATKSITQCFSHIIKAGYWSIPVIVSAGWGAMPPVWLLLAAIPLSMTGTRLGKLVLDRMSDINFRRWLKGLITAIGAIFLLRAAAVF